MLVIILVAFALPLHKIGQPHAVSASISDADQEALKILQILYSDKTLVASACAPVPQPCVDPSASRLRATFSFAIYKDQTHSMIEPPSQVKLDQFTIVKRSCASLKRAMHVSDPIQTISAVACGRSCFRYSVRRTRRLHRNWKHHLNQFLDCSKRHQTSTVRSRRTK